MYQFARDLIACSRNDDQRLAAMAASEYRGYIAILKVKTMFQMCGLGITGLVLYDLGLTDEPSFCRMEPILLDSVVLRTFGFGVEGYRPRQQQRGGK